MTDANLSLGVDATGVQVGRDQAVRSLEDIRRAAAQTAAEMGSAGQRMAQATRNAADRIRADMEAAIRQINELRGAGATAEQFSRVLEDFRRNARTALDGLGGPALARAGATFRQAMQQVTEAAKQATAVIGGGGGGAGSGGGGGMFGGGLSAAVVALGTTLGTVAGNFITNTIGTLRQFASSVIWTADAWDMFHRRINVAVGATGDANRVFDQLRRSVVSIGGEMLPAIDLFQNMSRAASTIGATTSQMLKFVDVVQKLGVIGGAGPAQSAAGLLQLSQGLSANIVRGDELRSIIENLPELANAIATGLGVTIGQLRRLGEEGALTGRRVLEAVLGQADDVERKYRTMGMSLSQAIQGFATAWTAELDRLNQQLGITHMLAAAVRALTPNPPTIEEAERRTEDRARTTISSFFGREPRTGSELLAFEEAQANIALNNFERNAREAAEYWNNYGKKIEGLRTNFHNIMRDLDPVEEKFSKLRDVSQQLNEAIEELAISSEDYERATQLLADAALKVKSPIEELTNAIRNQVELSRLTGLARARRQAEIKAGSITTRSDVIDSAVDAASAEYLSNLERQIEAIERQAAAQRRLADATVGATTEELRRLEVEAKVAAFAAEHFKGTEDLTGVTNRYRTAVEALSRAEERLAQARSRRQFEFEIESQDFSLGEDPEAGLREALERSRTMRADNVTRTRQLEDQIKAARESVIAYDEVTRTFRVYDRELRVVQAQQQLLNAGFAEGETEARKLAEAVVDQQMAFDRLREAQDETVQRLNDMKQAGRDATQAISTFAEDAILRFESLGDVAMGFLQTIEQIAVRYLVTKPLEYAIGPIFEGIAAGIWGSATGNVFRDGRIVPFASGGVITQPIMFPMRNGMGLAGEAGEEGILPLERINGVLGVNARIASQPVKIEIIDQRRGGAPIQTQTATGPNGEQIVRMWVRDEMKANIESGTTDGSFGRRFGVTPIPTNRG